MRQAGQQVVKLAEIRGTAARKSAFHRITIKPRRDRRYDR
jgi:hypothetical protein